MSLFVLNTYLSILFLEPKKEIYLYVDLHVDVLFLLGCLFSPPALGVSIDSPIWIIWPCCMNGAFPWLNLPTEKPDGS